MMRRIFAMVIGCDRRPVEKLAPADLAVPSVSKISMGCASSCSLTRTPRWIIARSNSYQSTVPLLSSSNFLKTLRRMVLRDAAVR